MATIVFCEDDPKIGKLIGAALRNSPHEVHLATNGVDGLALIERLRPAAVFTDVAMRGLDGLALLDRLKGHPGLAHIPVILVTALLQRAQVEDGYRRGAAAIVRKPFSVAELRTCIERFAGGDDGPPGEAARTPEGVCAHREP